MMPFYCNFVTKSRHVPGITVPAAVTEQPTTQPFRKMAPLFAELLEHWAGLSAGTPSITVAQLHLLSCSWHMHLGLQAERSNAGNSVGSDAHGPVASTEVDPALARHAATNVDTDVRVQSDQIESSRVPLPHDSSLSVASYHEVYGRPHCRSTCTYHDDSADRFVRGYNEFVLPDVGVTVNAFGASTDNALGKQLQLGAPALAASGAPPFSRASAEDATQGGADAIVCKVQISLVRCRVILMAPARPEYHFLRCY